MFYLTLYYDARKHKIKTDLYLCDSSVQNQRYNVRETVTSNPDPSWRIRRYIHTFCYHSKHQTASRLTREVPTYPVDQLPGTQWKILFVSMGFQGRKKSAVRRLKRTPYVETTSVHVWPKPLVSFSWNSVSLYKSPNEQTRVSWKSVRLLSHLA